MVSVHATYIWLVCDCSKGRFADRRSLWGVICCRHFSPEQVFIRSRGIFIAKGSPACSCYCTGTSTSLHISCDLDTHCAMLLCQAVCKHNSRSAAFQDTAGRRSTLIKSLPLRIQTTRTFRGCSSWQPATGACTCAVHATFRILRIATSISVVERRQLQHTKTPSCSLRSPLDTQRAKMEGTVTLEPVCKDTSVVLPLGGLLACNFQLLLPVIDPSRGAEGLSFCTGSDRPGSSRCLLPSSSMCSRKAMLRATCQNCQPVSASY